MMGYDDQGPIIQEHSGISINEFLTKVFFRMFLGLLATAIVASYTYYSGLLENIIENNGFIICAIIELAIVLLFSFGFRKFSPGVVTALFFIYAMVTGVTLSVIFAVFEIETIAYTFIGTSAIFGIMAYIGKTTTKDLSSLGTILSVGLIVSIVVSLINIIIGSSMIDIILDWIVMIIFIGFTAYDMNKIIQLRDSGTTDEEHLYIYGAMELYLDFINLFIRILSVLSRHRD